MISKVNIETGCHPNLFVEKERVNLSILNQSNTKDRIIRCSYFVDMPNLLMNFNSQI